MGVIANGQLNIPSVSNHFRDSESEKQQERVNAFNFHNPQANPSLSLYFAPLGSTLTQTLNKIIAR
uniref:Lectin-like protein At1g53070 n=1 Tax=Rhizophora mucronata TaxID=61149 RepID=A0A2P2N303_RHIMU